MQQEIENYFLKPFQINQLQMSTTLITETEFSW